MYTLNLLQHRSLFQLDIVIANYGIDNIGIALAYEITDFNEDIWMDIAIANYGADYVEILLKTC
jgi:hypothetical protein